MAGKKKFPFCSTQRSPTKKPEKSISEKFEYRYAFSEKRILKNYRKRNMKKNQILVLMLPKKESWPQIMKHYTGDWHPHRLNAGNYRERKRRQRNTIYWDRVGSTWAHPKEKKNRTILSSRNPIKESKKFSRRTKIAISSVTTSQTQNWYTRMLMRKIPEASE